MESIISIIYGGIVGTAFGLSILNYFITTKLEEKLKSVEAANMRHGYELFNMLGHSEIGKLRHRVSKLEQGSDYSGQVKSRLIRKGQELGSAYGKSRTNLAERMLKDFECQVSPDDKIKHLQKKIAKDLLELKKEVTRSHEIAKNEELTTSCISNFIREVEAELNPKSDDTF